MYVANVVLNAPMKCVYSVNINVEFLWKDNNTEPYSDDMHQARREQFR